MRGMKAWDVAISGHFLVTGISRPGIYELISCIATLVGDRRSAAVTVSSTFVLGMPRYRCFGKKKVYV